MENAITLPQLWSMRYGKWRKKCLSHYLIFMRVFFLFCIDKSLLINIKWNVRFRNICFCNELYIESITEHAMRSYRDKSQTRASLIIKLRLGFVVATVPWKETSSAFWNWFLIQMVVWMNLVWERKMLLLRSQTILP